MRFLCSLLACTTLLFPLQALLFAAAQPESQAWESLFDGKTLTNWKSTDFGGEGRVYAQDGQLILETGATLTGVTWTGAELPRENYEIRLDAMRVEGGDFFCGLTFPVRENHCTLIVGGWGGYVVGLSSLDGLDASENETTSTMSFQTGRWYPIRVRVTEARIEAWIDDEKVVEVDTRGRHIAVRPEVDPSRPLGIATWITTAALRAIQLRRLNRESYNHKGHQEHKGIVYLDFHDRPS